MALCIRDMAKAAGAYAKFENPDQFRPVDTENGMRLDLLFVGIQERQILGDVLVTEPCCKTLTRLRQGPKVGQPREEMSPRCRSTARQPLKVVRFSPLHLRDIWPPGQTLSRLLRSDDEARRGVPRYPRSGHQHVLAPEDLLAQDYDGGDYS